MSGKIIADKQATNRNLEEHSMNKKEKRISIAGIFFLAFLFLCAVINFTNGQIGGAIASLGAGIFFLLTSLAVYEKVKENKQ